MRMHAFLHTHTRMTSVYISFSNALKSHTVPSLCVYACVDVFVNVSLCVWLYVNTHFALDGFHGFVLCSVHTCIHQTLLQLVITDACIFALPGLRANMLWRHKLGIATCANNNMHFQNVKNHNQSKQSKSVYFQFIIHAFFSEVHEDSDVTPNRLAIANQSKHAFWSGTLHKQWYRIVIIQMRRIVEINSLSIFTLER